MIPVSEMLEAVRQQLLTTANGDMQLELYNGFSKLAELDLIDWLTGKLQGKTLPDSYNSIKQKEYIAMFIEPYFASAVNGKISKPEDFYQTDDLFLLGSPTTGTCDDSDDNTEVCDTEVEILDSDVYNTRCKTYIKALKPSLSKPIAKEIGNNFEFKPKDVGSVRLDYIRYPKFAQIVVAIDPLYNEEIVDVNASINYEWDQKAMPYLLFFIVDRFSNRTANTNMKQMNALSIDNPEK